MRLERAFETESPTLSRDEAATVQFSLRLKEPLRARLEEQARRRGVSLNNEMIDRLSRSFDADERSRADGCLADLLAEVQTIRMMMEASRG